MDIRRPKNLPPQIKCSILMMITRDRGFRLTDIIHRGALIVHPPVRLIANASQVRRPASGGFLLGLPKLRLRHQILRNAPSKWIGSHIGSDHVIRSWAYKN